MSSPKHYHVSCNMAGYLPDSDPELFLTLADAQEGALYHAENFREQGDTDGRGRWVPEYRVRGNKREGYVVSRHPYDAYSLDYYISISDPCTDASCADYFTEEGELDERWF